MPSHPPTLKEGSNEDTRSIKSNLSDIYEFGNFVAQELVAAAYKHSWEDGTILRRPREQARVIDPSSSRLLWP